jgi:hypothetical protein
MDIAITEVFHSAEKNFRDRADADWLATAEKLDDISNERYFEVLMRKTALEDPVLQRQPIRSPLGSSWRWRLHDERMEELLPALSNPLEVARYTHADVRRLRQACGIPARFQRSLLRAVEHAAVFAEIVRTSSGGLFHCFVAPTISIEGGEEQPVLAKQLRGAFKGLSDGGVRGLTREMHLDRSIRPPGVILLQTIGLVDGHNIGQQPPDDAYLQAIQICEAIAAQSGHTYAYVEFILSANFTWSHMDVARFPLSRHAVCSFDNPLCDICAHSTYCQRLGLEELVFNREQGWLESYAPTWRFDVSDIVPLGYLPGLAAEAVWQSIDDDNSLWSRTDTLRIPASDAPNIRAVLTEMPLSEVRSRIGESQYGSEYANIVAGAPGDAERNVPLLAGQFGEEFHGFRGHALLDAYEAQGCETVPLLAVDWGQVGNLLVRKF